MSTEKSRTPQQLALYAAGALTLGWATVPVVEFLVHGDLPLWLHLPLVGLALGVLSISSLAAGALWVEYRLQKGDRI